MLLEKFNQTIKTKGRSKATLDLLDMTIGKAEKWFKKPLEDVTYDELLKYIEHIKENGLVIEGKGRPLAKSSIWTVESKLLQFYTFCFEETDDPKYHKLVKKIKSIKVDKPKNELRPQDIPLPDDIKKLINVATLERDRCLVASLFEGGLRLGEILALPNDGKAVEMNEQGQEVIFHIPNQEGCKTGARDVLCLEIFGYVQDWLKCNPSDRFIPLSESGVQKVIRKLYERAGINKPDNPHMLRHGSITNAVIIKMNTIQICMRYWGVVHSDMLQTYIHLSEQMVSSGYRDAKGMGNGNGNTVINPLSVRCVSCGRLIQSGSLCKTCEDSKKLSEENAELKARLDEQQQQMDFIMRTIKAGAKI